MILQAEQVLTFSLAFAIMAAVLWFVVALIWRVWSDRSRRRQIEAGARPCPECGYDMRGGSKRCPECGAVYVDRRRYIRRLANEWPSNPIAPRRAELDESPELVLSTDDGQEAELLHEQLTARGMASFIDETTIGAPIRGQRPTVFFRVMVYSGDLGAAREYLRRAQGVAGVADC